MWIEWKKPTDLKMFSLIVLFGLAGCSTTVIFCGVKKFRNKYKNTAADDDSKSYEYEPLIQNYNNESVDPSEPLNNKVLTEEPPEIYPSGDRRQGRGSLGEGGDLQDTNLFLEDIKVDLLAAGEGCPSVQKEVSELDGFELVCTESGDIWYINN